MGHRSRIVRHRPTTLPGAPSRTWARRLGRAHKKKVGPYRPARSTYVTFILEGRRLGGSIGVALRSIVLLLLLQEDGTTVKFFRSILAPVGFGESGDLHERPTVGTIDRRSSRSTTASRVFDGRSAGSIDGSESSVRGRRAARAAGIPNERLACESISEFEERSSVLEGPAEPSSANSTPIATGIERSSGSTGGRILSSIAGQPDRSPIRSVKSIGQRDIEGINRGAARVVVGLEERYPIIARLILAFHQAPSEQAIARVGRVSSLLGGSINQFSQPAVLKATHFFSSSSSWPRRPLIHVVAAMTFGRETSFR